MKHAYGWIKDRPDERDWLEPEPEEAKVVELPATVSLRKKMPGIYDQGQLGSCVGNGTAAVLEREEIKQDEGVKIPSRLFIYYVARSYEGTTGEDAGAEIRDGVKAVAKCGAPPETFWPYKIAKFAIKPPAIAFTEAKKHEAITYSRVTQSEAAFKTVLASGYPIVYGFTVYASFESDEVAATGMVPMPNPNEEILGGHCVDMIGYKTINNTPYFECRNSWGKDWGDKGYFWMPSLYLTSPNLASDFWVIRRVM